MQPDADSTDLSGPVADRTEGGDPDWRAHFRAELRAQLDAGGTLFGDDADGVYRAITKRGRRRVVPGTGGLVSATED